jgi:uncharacterized protein YdeI (YjbR/CyaY-like superfamily)
MARKSAELAAKTRKPKARAGARPRADSKPTGKKGPAKKTAPAELPTLSFETQAAFEEWLAENHATVPGAWLRFAKKGTGITSINYPQAVEAALCWGWIDGQAKGIDDRWYLQRFTPRRAQSVWSKINCGKVTDLIAAGRMQPPGLAEVERAKRDGRWDRAYDSPSAATVPDDLAAALARDKKASAFFDGLDSRNRYAILHRIQTAKKPETRQKRITEFVAMLGRREKLYP